MSKPINKPGWTSTSNPSSEPTVKKTQGWSAGEKPSAEHMNWLFKTISEWIEHVDVDQVKGETGDAGPQGAKGEAGDQGPQGPAGSGSLSATDEARIDALESKARISTPSSVSAGVPYNGQATSEVEVVGSTIDWSLSSSQKIILSSNTSLSFTNGISGKVYFLSVQQPSAGSALVTWPASVSWNSGSAPTLSTSGNTKDVIGFYFDGSNYTGYSPSSLKGFKIPQVGPENKTGYIVGGYTGGSSVGPYISKVEKLNFNSDLIITVIDTLFGYTNSTSGGLIFPTATSGSSWNNEGQGTQSSTHGYQLHSVYSSLPSVSGYSTSVAAKKLSFSNNVWSLCRVSSSSPPETRAGLVQSQTAAYSRIALGSFAKFIFSTDVSSYVSTPSTGSGNSSKTAGLSKIFEGIFWVPSQGCPKITFSDETFSTITASSLVSVNNGSEGVDGDAVGYVQTTTSTTGTGTTTCYKFDKSSYAQATLANTLSGPGNISSATQGSSFGYFCGGANVTTLTANGIGSSIIKKISFSTDAYSLHSQGLNQARTSSAGFEG